jgi:splicing factor 3B subunit 3
VFVSRLSEEAVTAEDDDPSGAQFRYEKGVLNGAPYKVPLTATLSPRLCVSLCLAVRADSLQLSEVAHFHLGDVVTSLQKTSLVPGGAEVLLYTTIMGSIGTSRCSRSDAVRLTAWAFQGHCCR